MHIKTMEGLVGARTNMNLLDTPFRVFKEARRKGDTGTMARAMEYAGDFSGKAEEYQAKADKGMEEEAKEVREKAETQLENAIQKRKEEREELSSDVSAQETTATNKLEPVIYTKTGEAVKNSSESDINISVSV